MAQAFNNSTFITFEDGCVPDWFPTAGRQLNVDVLRHADWVFQPGRNLVVDIDCETFESCINDWFPQVGDDLQLEFKCCSIPCSNDWEDVAGDALILDATEDRSCDQSWKPVEGNALDFDFDCCAGTYKPASGNALEFDFVCPGEDVILDVPACDSNCYGTWYPQPGDNLDIEYVCCADGGVKPDVILGSFSGADGSTAFFDFLSDPRFTLDLGFGETAVVNLSTFVNVTFAVNFETGEQISIPLATSMVVPMEAGFGETLVAVLNTYPAIPLDARTAADGQTVNAELYVTRQFSVDFNYGEETKADLEITPYEGLQAPAFDGQELSVGLTTITGFQAPMFDGQTATATLVTEATLDLGFHEGSTAFVDLRIAPPADLAVVFDHGEQTVASVAAGQISFGIIENGHGEQTVADLDIREQPGLVINFFNGEQSSVAVSWAANLGAIEFYDGSTGTATLDEDPNILMPHGETLTVSMATSDAIVPSARHGEEVSVSLDVRPSSPLGQFVFYDGQESYSQVAVLKAIPLEVVFYNSVTTTAGIDASTFFDMDVSCGTNHYPGQKDVHNIELNDAEFPDQRFDGDRVCVTMDLRAQPRFQFNFFEGARLDNTDVNPYIQGVRVAHGEGMSIEFESVIDVPLCPGNFIPDGDNVYVELDVADDTRCVSDYAYDGTTMSVGTLQAHPRASAAVHEGSTMSFDLTLSPAWILNFFEGPTLTMANNPEFSPAASFGAAMTVSFYIDPWVAADGATMEASLVIKYDVKFDEMGCLDNEFIYQDENGDPIPELFNPVAVELEPWQHDVKAHCE